MGLIAAIIAVLCATALIIELDTGSLQALQVAGLGILALAVAFVAGASWPWPKG